MPSAQPISILGTVQSSVRCCARGARHHHAEWVRAALCMMPSCMAIPTLQYIGEGPGELEAVRIPCASRKSYPQQPAAGTSSSRRCTQNPSAQQMVDNEGHVGGHEWEVTKAHDEQRETADIVRLSQDLSIQSLDEEGLTIYLLMLADVSTAGLSVAMQKIAQHNKFFPCRLRNFDTVGKQLRQFM